MFRKSAVLAILSLLLIPVITVGGAMLANAIDPEIALRTSDYQRYYALLSSVRNLALMAVFAASASLWFLTCFLVLKSKQQSYLWMLLALLGPFGLIALTMLGDNKPVPGDRHRQFIRRLNVYLRLVYELCLFVVAWLLAFQTMLVTRDLMIQYQSARTGVPVARIIEEQTASSGMHAFGEGLEVLFLVTLYYLLWPFCFNLVARLAMPRNPPSKDEPPLSGHA